jgi:hypothetical protein
MTLLSSFLLTSTIFTGIKFHTFRAFSTRCSTRKVPIQPLNQAPFHTYAHGMAQYRAMRSILVRIRTTLHSAADAASTQLDTTTQTHQSVGKAGNIHLFE